MKLLSKYRYEALACESGDWFWNFRKLHCRRDKAIRAARENARRIARPGKPASWAVKAYRKATKVAAGEVIKSERTGKTSYRRTIK